LTLFSMAGIPPLAGFFSKLYVLLALVQVGYYGTALLVVLLSVVSSVYYLRLIKILLFELPEPPVRFGFFRSMPPAYSIVLIFSSTFNLFFIFFQTTVLFFIGTIFF